MRSGVDRRILQQALQQGQQISAQASSGQGFDPRGGVGVLAAQLATAGIGAYAQNKARKQLAELEQQQQQAFARANPELAGLAGQLSPEARENLALKKALFQVQNQFAKPEPLSPEGKRAADVKAGLIPEGMSFESEKDINKKKERIFKQSADLRKEFTKNSGEFIKQRDAFNRIEASVEDPSAAGDLALIFNYMKILDPGSTVREGEFANAENSAGIPTRLRAKYNKVITGERLETTQRDDFFNRSQKLYDKALTTQKRRVNQFKGIAERNELPVEDVILDLIGGDPNKTKTLAEVEKSENPTLQISPQDREGALAELRRRGKI